MRVLAPGVLGHGWPDLHHARHGLMAPSGPSTGPGYDAGPLGFKTLIPGAPDFSVRKSAGFVPDELWSQQGNWRGRCLTRSGPGACKTPKRTFIN